MKGEARHMARKKTKAKRNCKNPPAELLETRGNKKYKDRLFRMIFQDKNDLLSLYNAVNQSHYTNPEELEITTLDNVLYMGMKNDLSFLIDSVLNLYEAQSSWNPNMPLRGLAYFSRMYAGYVASRKLDVYSQTRIPLPAPRYLVFYNGTKDEPERLELRLSDSFISTGNEPIGHAGMPTWRGSAPLYRALPQESKAPSLAEASLTQKTGCETKPEPCLECVATVININWGQNPELMAQCRRLYEYAFLVDQIRKGLAQGLTLSGAIDEGIAVCLQEGILTEFLTRHQGEVKIMILTEYDEALHLENTYQCGYSDGEARGIEIGEKAGEARGIKIGEKAGEARGIKIGEEKLQRINQLYQHLSSQNRMEELKQALADDSFRQKLLEEFLSKQE